MLGYRESQLARCQYNFVTGRALSSHIAERNTLYHLLFIFNFRFQVSTQMMTSSSSLLTRELTPKQTCSYTRWDQNQWILQDYCELLTCVSKLLFHRMSLERDLELVKSLTQYPITHQPFKMRRRTLTLLKRLKRQISARSWECFSPVSRTSLVSFSSFGWRGLWALAAPLRGSLLYFFVAAL